MLGLIIAILLLLLGKAELKLRHLPDEKTSRESLTQCIKQASKQFFLTQETITFAIPLVEVKHTDPSATVLNSLLLPEMFQENQWCFLINNFSNPIGGGERLYRKQSSSYIIQIRKKGEIGITVVHLKNDFWNPHAKFIIVSATVFEEPIEIVREVVEVLWNQKVLNAVVLLADPDDNNTYKVYTWFPFKKGYCGDNFTSVTIIDSCSFGKMEKNVDWFKSKLPHKFNSCEIKVNYVDWPPYVLNLKNNSVGVANHYFDNYGIEINLLNMIANILNLRMVYVEAGGKQVWGEMYDNGTATGNMLALRENLVDIVVGGYAKTYIRSVFFDASSSYVQEALIWCTPHSSISTNMESFINALNMETWLLTLLLYGVVTIIIWQLSRRRLYELLSYQSFIKVLLYNFGVSIGIAVALPRTSLIRYLMALWIIFSFNLDSAYVTYLTSIMANPNVHEEYLTGADIYKNDLITYFLPNTIRYFNDNKIVLDKWNNCDNIISCLNYVAIRKDSAFCLPTMYQQYIYNSYTTKDGTQLLNCFKHRIVSYPINMLMRKGFHLSQLMNLLVNRIFSGGFLVKWERDILQARAKNLTIDVMMENDEEKFTETVLRFANLKPVFFILLIGELVALVVFLVEFVPHTKKGKRILKIFFKRSVH